MKLKNDGYWISAMQNELNQFERNDVLELVLRPNNQSIIRINKFLGTQFMNIGLLLETKLH